MNKNSQSQTQNQMVEIPASRLEYLLRRSDECSKLQAELCQTQEMLLRSNTELDSYRVEQKSSVSRKSTRLSDMSLKYLKIPLDAPNATSPTYTPNSTSRHVESLTQEIHTLKNNLDCQRSEFMKQLGEKNNQITDLQTKLHESYIKLNCQEVKDKEVNDLKCTLKNKENEIAELREITQSSSSSSSLEIKRNSNIYNSSSSLSPQLPQPSYSPNHSNSRSFNFSNSLNNSNSFFLSSTKELDFSQSETAYYYEQYIKNKEIRDKYKDLLIQFDELKLQFSQQQSSLLLLSQSQPFSFNLSPSRLTSSLSSSFIYNNNNNNNNLSSHLKQNYYYNNKLVIINNDKEIITLQGNNNDSEEKEKEKDEMIMKLKQEIENKNNEIKRLNFTIKSLKVFHQSISSYTNRVKVLENKLHNKEIELKECIKCLNNNNNNEIIISKSLSDVTSTDSSSSSCDEIIYDEEIKPIIKTSIQKPSKTQIQQPKDKQQQQIINMKVKNINENKNRIVFNKEKSKIPKYGGMKSRLLSINTIGEDMNGNNKILMSSMSERVSSFRRYKSSA